MCATPGCILTRRPAEGRLVGDGERISVPGVHSLIPTAEAIVGRPLRPVSVAGVGLRTVSALCGQRLQLLVVSSAGL
jgi:hypothetical protein